MAFGGRILPDVAKKSWPARASIVAKYLNSPETLLFHKRTVLYAADLARSASREAGGSRWLRATLTSLPHTRLGLRTSWARWERHWVKIIFRALRRLADRVVLVYDADAAGQAAADRALEFFLGSDLDLRVLTLPANLDPCDYLLEEGAEAFRALLDQAADPLSYLLARAAVRFELDSGEGSRRAAEWILGLMNHIPATHHLGLEVKQAKVLDTLSQRLRVPLDTLNRLRRQLQAADGAAGRGRCGSAAARGCPAACLRRRGRSRRSFARGGRDPPERARPDRPGAHPDRPARSGNDQMAVAPAGPSALKDAPLREILQVCYDLQNEGESSELRESHGPARRSGDPLAGGQLDRRDRP